MRPRPDEPTVVALGGAGAMGRVAVRVTAGWEDIGEVVVADLDGDRRRSTSPSRTGGREPARPSATPSR